MTRRFKSTHKFDKQIRSLDKNTLRQAYKAIELFKKIQGTSKFCEIRVNVSVRIIIEVISDGDNQINTFYIVGTHDEVFPPR